MTDQPCTCLKASDLIRAHLEGVEVPSCGAHPTAVDGSSSMPLNAPTSDIARLLAIATIPATSFDDLPPAA